MCYPSICLSVYLYPPVAYFELFGFFLPFFSHHLSLIYSIVLPTSLVSTYAQITISIFAVYLVS